MVDRAVAARNDVISYDELIQRAKARQRRYQNVIDYFDERQTVLHHERDVEMVSYDILPGILRTLRNLTWLDRDIRNDLILFFLAAALRKFIVFNLPDRNWEGNYNQNIFRNCVNHDGWLVPNVEGVLSQILLDAEGFAEDYERFRVAMEHEPHQLDNHDEVLDEVFTAYRNLLVMIADLFQNEKQVPFSTFCSSLLSWQKYKQMGRFAHIMINDFSDDLRTRILARRNECAHEAELWNHRKFYAMWVPREIPNDVARNIWDRVRQSVDESEEMRADNIPPAISWN